MEDQSSEILNAGYGFVRQASLDIRSRFEGIPQTALLHEGESLFRFVEAGFAGSEFEFWLPIETYHHFRLTTAPAWAVWRNANSRGPAFPASFCVANLKRPVYGFKGLSAAGKKRINRENLTRNGLVWIPGLSTQDFELKYYSLGISLPKR
jgi:hypothetical protein